jgi:acetyltransferase
VEKAVSIRNLKHLFQPQSVAVIGASNKSHSVGATVLQNLTIGGFAGPVMPVNPKYESLAGLKVYPGVADLPAAPQLAVICTPPATVPGLIRELGALGTRAAVVLTTGLRTTRDLRGRSMEELMLAEAKPHLLRILGPNCVGLLVPAIGLNASFAHTSALPGKIAFVSQSGAMVTGVLDWAKSRGIGFSKFISLGDSADVDFGDVLDYLASDWETQAILLYVEAISAARKFMSAARAAARSKPTLVIKAGRVPEAARAATSHTGAMAGSDQIYDAAIRRAGMLRVFATEDLFDAVETLARARPVGGDRLVVLTNGGGPGVMATDTLIGAGGRLARLSDATLQKLDEALPPTWSHGNPVDIMGDAPAERYVHTMEILASDRAADAMLFIHAPTAIVPSVDIAAAVAPIAKTVARNVLACWLGGDAVAQARDTFAEAGIPTFDTPDKAVRGFLRIVQYQRNQELLMQVPSVSNAVVENRARAQALVRDALAAGRMMLPETESKAVLAAYGIPVVETRTAGTADEAARVAAEIGFPVAVKILSPDIRHKSDVGGVVLDLESAEAVRAAVAAITKRLRELRSSARIQGFAVQAMARKSEGRELIIGVVTDPVFGPVVLFGQGGIAVEVTADHAIALPPLNMVLARELISRTRVSKLLQGYRNRRPADIDAICSALIQVCHLIIDIPEIVEMDINPLLADAKGVVALDARINITRTDKRGIDRLAIRPYPAELEEWVDWQGERILIRPVKPEDAPQHVAFFNSLDPEDVRYRIFTRMRELQHSQLARLTQIDYDREMAFIATRVHESGESETLGVARAIADPDNNKAEFAIIVRSDLKGKGLGRILFRKLIDYCRSRGMQQIIGETLNYNKALIRLVREFGFEVKPSPDGDTMLLTLDLRARQTSATQK